MKSPLLSMALACILGGAAFAEPPDVVRGKHIAPDVKLIVRADSGEKLSGEQLGRVNVMVAFLKGYTDGIQPMQKLYPLGPTAVPETLSIGEFAKRLDAYLDQHQDKLEDPTAALLFDFASATFPNPYYNPDLMPRSMKAPLPPPPKK